MLKLKIIGLLLLSSLVLFSGASPSLAVNCEGTIERHMVGEATLTAQYVAAAEKNGISADTDSFASIPIYFGCPLYAQKRTLLSTIAMSALCQ